MAVTEDQKRRMAKNLDRAFELLNTVMELRLAYVKKIYPNKSESELIQKMNRDMIKAKEREWRLRKV